jgi:hypothetical protein
MLAMRGHRHAPETAKCEICSTGCVVLGLKSLLATHGLLLLLENVTKLCFEIVTRNSELGRVAIRNSGSMSLGLFFLLAGLLRRYEGRMAVTLEHGERVRRFR